MSPQELAGNCLGEIPGKLEHNVDQEDERNTQPRGEAKYQDVHFFARTGNIGRIWRPPRIRRWGTGLSVVRGSLRGTSGRRLHVILHRSGSCARCYCIPYR